MLILLTIFFFTGSMSASLKYSTVSTLPFRIAIALVLGIGIHTAYPYLINLSYLDASTWLNRKESLASISLIQTMETLGTLILGYAVFRDRSKSIRTLFLKALFLLPPFMALAGAWAIQLILFHSLSGWNLPQLSLAFTAAAAVFTVLLTEAARLILRQASFRIELAGMISLLNLIIAMFLPVLGTSFQDVAFEWGFEPLPTLLTLVVITTACLAGYVLRRNHNSWRKGSNG